MKKDTTQQLKEKKTFREHVNIAYKRGLYLGKAQALEDELKFLESLHIKAIDEECIHCGTLLYGRVTEIKKQLGEMK